MFKAFLPGRYVESAGLGALVDHGVEPTARELAEADGLNIESHQARQITQDMLQSADLILVMSEGQRLAIGEMAPAALGKTMLIGRWLDDGKGVEIPDPFRKSREAFEHVHQMLKEATASWATKI